MFTEQFPLAVMATLLANILRIPFPPWLERLAVIVGIIFFLLASISGAWTSSIAYDFQSFWKLGKVLISGQDVIAFIAENPLPPLNPPSAYPLFAAFALLPMQASLVTWVTISALICVLLVPLSCRTLIDREDAGIAILNRREIALVSAAFVLSNAPRSMIQSGQLGVVTALGLIAALASQSRGKSGLAGFWLVVGTIKPNTTIPILLLFLRRRDYKTWGVAAILGLALLAVGWGANPTHYLGVYLRTIKKLSGPGEVNDVSFTGPQTAGMVGLDYALYRLGFRAPGSAERVQLMVFLLIAPALILRLFRRRGTLPTGGDCAQIALCSTVFSIPPHT